MVAMNELRWTLGGQGYTTTTITTPAQSQMHHYVNLQKLIFKRVLLLIISHPHFSGTADCPSSSYAEEPSPQTPH